jgi:hypothetical protein
MESKVKLLPFFRFAVHSLMAVVLLAIVAVPLSAGTITVTVQSDASNTGASVASTSDSRLTSGDISGLTFSPVGTVDTGSFTYAPPGSPAVTIQVQVPPQPSYYQGNSGFIETTFTLPAGFSGISLLGAANVDDWGYVFLNGYLISPLLNQNGNTAFSTSNPLYFLQGPNTLVISDSNVGGGPSGVAFYANIDYSASAVPEPASMIMLATGLAGLAGAIRRKLA